MPNWMGDAGSAAVAGTTASKTAPARSVKVATLVASLVDGPVGRWFMVQTGQPGSGQASRSRLAAAGARCAPGDPPRLQARLGSPGYLTGFPGSITGRIPAGFLYE